MANVSAKILAGPKAEWWWTGFKEEISSLYHSPKAEEGTELRETQPQVLPQYPPARAALSSASSPGLINGFFSSTHDSLTFHEPRL